MVLNNKSFLKSITRRVNNHTCFFRNVTMMTLMSVVKGLSAVRGINFSFKSVLVLNWQQKEHMFEIKWQHSRLRTYFGNLSLSIFMHWRVGLSCSVHLTISLYSARDSFIFLLSSSCICRCRHSECCNGCSLKCFYKLFTCPAHSI